MRILISFVYLFVISLANSSDSTAFKDSFAFQKRTHENNDLQTLPFLETIGKGKQSPRNQASTSSFSNPENSKNLQLSLLEKAHRANLDHLLSKGLRVKGLVHTKIEGNPNAKTHYPTSTIYEGRKSSVIVNSFHHNPISQDQNEHDKLSHAFTFPLEVQHPSGRINKDHPITVKDGSFIQGSMCVYVGERCLWPTDKQGYDDKKYWNRLPNRLKHYKKQSSYSKPEKEVIGRFKKNLNVIKSNGFELKTHSFHNTVGDSDSIRLNPEIEIHQGKQAGHYFSALLGTESPPNSPSGNSSFKRKSPSPQIEGQGKGKRNRKDHDDNHVDTTLKLGKRNLNNLFDDIIFQKRTGEKRKHDSVSSHSPTTSRQNDRYIHIRKDFANQLRSLQGEGKEIKGAIHTKVEGNPNSSTEFPTTIIHDGKKGGTILSHFYREHSPPTNPSQTKPSLSSIDLHHLTSWPKGLHSETRKNPNANQMNVFDASFRQGSICTYIGGRCLWPSDSHHEQTDEYNKRLKSRVKYFPSKHNPTEVRQKMIGNMSKVHSSGHKAILSSTNTIESIQISSRDLPELEILPGNKSGHYFSLLTGKTSPNNSPTRPSSPVRSSVNLRGNGDAGEGTSKRSRNDDHDEHVDTTLKLGKRSLNDSFGLVILQKRAGDERRKNNPSSNPHPKTFPHNSSQRHRSINAAKEFTNHLSNTRTDGRTVKGAIHTKIDGDPKATTEFPTIIIHDGKKGGMILSQLYREPSPIRTSHSQNPPSSSLDLHHLTSWPKGLHPETHQNPQVSQMNVPNASFRQGSTCTYIGGRCLWPSDSNYEQTPEYNKHLRSQIKFFDSKHNPIELRQKLLNNIEKVHRSGYKPILSSTHTIESISTASRDRPDLEFLPGKKSGHYFSLLTGYPSPKGSPTRSPSPVRSENKEENKTLDLTKQLNRSRSRSPSSSSGQGTSKRRRKDDDYHKHVDTTLRLGKRSFQEFNDGIYLQKRVNEAGPSNNHINHNDNDQLEHNEIHKQFRKSILELSKENKDLKGVFHVQVEGNPMSRNRFPTTTIRENKKGGTIVSAFLQKPSLSPTQRLISPQPSSPKGIVQGCLSVYVGVCHTPYLPNKERVENRRFEPNRAGFITSKRSDTYSTFRTEIQRMENHGYKYKTTSTHHLPSNNDSQRNLPELEIQPGNQTGHFISIFAGKDSPDRNRIRNRSPTNSDERRERVTPRLIDHLDIRPHPHHHQRTERRRARSEESVDSNRSKKPNLNLRLG